MREFFQRVEDGVDVNIEVDMNAFAYSQKYSWLFSIFVKFDANENESEAYEEFLEMKESLIIALEYEEKAKFVGIRVVDGWSEFYFYAQDSKGLESTVKEILKANEYMFESSVVKDNKWDFHHKNLTPSELELAHIQSEKIIFLLKEEEDDLEVKRAVEHYISFLTPTQKNRFLNTLALEGVSFKDDIESEEFDFGIALVKKHALTSDEVRKTVNEIFEAVKKEDGFYEGWSTILASELVD
ncbi:MAG: DUF695 domain-containing protein [Sulfurimonas sp.]